MALPHRPMTCASLGRKGARTARAICPSRGARRPSTRMTNHRRNAGVVVVCLAVVAAFVWWTRQDPATVEATADAPLPGAAPFAPRWRVAATPSAEFTTEVDHAVGAQFLDLTRKLRGFIVARFHANVRYPLYEACVAEHGAAARECRRIHDDI